MDGPNSPTWEPIQFRRPRGAAINPRPILHGRIWSTHTMPLPIFRYMLFPCSCSSFAYLSALCLRRIHQVRLKRTAYFWHISECASIGTIECARMGFIDPSIDPREQSVVLQWERSWLLSGCIVVVFQYYTVYSRTNGYLRGFRRPNTGVLRNKTVRPFILLRINSMIDTSWNHFFLNNYIYIYSDCAKCLRIHRLEKNIYRP